MKRVVFASALSSTTLAFVPWSSTLLEVSSLALRVHAFTLCFILSLDF